MSKNNKIHTKDKVNTKKFTLKKSNVKKFFTNLFVFLMVSAIVLTLLLPSLF